MENKQEVKMVTIPEEKLTMLLNLTNNAGVSIDQIPPSLQTKDYCIQYFSQYGSRRIENIKYINPDFLSDPGFIIDLIKSNPEIIRLLNGYDADLAVLAVAGNKYLISYISEDLIKQRLKTFIKLNPSYAAGKFIHLINELADLDKQDCYSIIIASSPESIELLPDSEYTDALDTVVINSPYIFSILSEKRRNKLSDETKIAVLKQDGMLLKYINDPTEEMIRTAIEQDPSAAVYIK